MSDIALQQEPLVDVQGQHIILLEDCVAIMVGDNTSQIEKRISFEDFHAIIGSVLNRRNEEKMDGFQLPSNCFYFAKSASAIELSCYYAERVAEMKYGPTSYNVKTPNFIISHKLDRQPNGSWRVMGSKYFCTDLRVGMLRKGHIFEPRSSSRVWVSPFPNTYVEGNMCYGGNSMPSNFVENNLTGLNWYYQFLFESPFNNDLGLRSIGDCMSVKEWFELLAKIGKDNGPFPYDKLTGYTAQA